MWAFVTHSPYTIAYGLLMLAVCVYVWRDRELQMVAGALFLTWAARTAAKLAFLPDERPAVLTVFEIALALMAFFALLSGRSRALRWVIVCCALSIASNIAYAYWSTVAEITRDQTRLWQLIGNLCFGAECLLVGFTGWSSRAGRNLHGWSMFRGAPSASGVPPRKAR